MNIDFTSTIPYIPYILKGIIITIQIAIVGAFFGSLIGFLFSLVSHRKNFLGATVRGFIDFFRGTPLIFQLSFFHYGLPQIFPGFLPTAFQTAMIIFSLNSSAYLAEILRAGIEAIDKGQIEAAKALGVSRFHTTIHIIIPQALRNVLPAIVNEFITLTKETSVASAIGVQEILRRQAIVTGTTYRPFEPLLLVGITYYVLIKILSILGKMVEKRLKYDSSSATI